MPLHVSQSLLFLTLLHCTNLLHLMHAPAPLHLILPPAPLLTFLCRPPGLYRVQEPNLAPLLAHFHSRGSLPALALLSWCQTETKLCPNIHFLETLALLDALDWRVFFGLGPTGNLRVVNFPLLGSLETLGRGAFLCWTYLATLDLRIL